ncbi:striatin-like [Pocillopora damicornis]|uniref:striatin-like n=1 Tax=Pocillopora damicornis TaxID=46731 RepID=UPI000F556BF4|nr:striatin-like [Pocillopora damicornis]
MENDNGGKVPVSSQIPENDSGTKYTIPGILHFIQHEWARFEMDRAHWDVEKAELQARIAFLQGERKGQENLKHDLIRRIKMLEYALKQERAKYHRLKYGTEVSPEKMSKEEENVNQEAHRDSNTNNTKPVVNWRQGRQLLRQYLQEVGYTDTILDVRSSRVRSILGLSVADGSAPDHPQPNGISGKSRGNEYAVIEEHARSPKRNEVGIIRKLPVEESDGALPIVSGKRVPVRPVVNSRAPIEDDLETEAAVLANFDFLQNDVEDEEDNEDDNDDDGGSADDESDDRDDLRLGRRMGKRAKQDLSKDAVDEMLSVDDETADALAEFDFVMGEDSGSETDVTVIEMEDNTAVLEDMDINMPEEGEYPAPQDAKDGSDTQNEWGVDSNLLAKLKEQYKKERKTKKSQKRPPRSALQAMLANLEGEDEMPQSAPSPAIINVPPPVRLSGTRATSEIPPIASVSVPGNASAGGKPSVTTPMATVDEPFESALGLGELASLTVTNEAEALSYEPNTKEEFRKTWSPKFTLRSHFDSIRSLYFHPTESALITASEDHSLKLWNLQKTVPQKKNNVLDVEPIYTFRGHSAPVLSVVINSTSEMCFSGSADSTIICWSIPSLDIDPYGPYNSENLSGMLVAHTDAVWDLAVQTGSLQLLSASADGTCRLWSPTLKSPLLNSYIPEQEGCGVPTSVDFIRTETSQMVASYSSAQCIIYDLETATPVVSLDSAKTYNNSPSTQINKVVSHPTLPLTVTAHEDRHIRFFDNNTGKQIHTMVAHLDAVTSLAVDPNGLYLLSGSHDCSIRLWNLDSKTCVQEITSHRKKFDEAIYDVAFHPNRPYIASAGADGLAKVFV